MLKRNTARFIKNLKVFKYTCSDWSLDSNHKLYFSNSTFHKPQTPSFFQCNQAHALNFALRFSQSTSVSSRALVWQTRSRHLITRSLIAPVIVSLSLSLSFSSDGEKVSAIASSFCHFYFRVNENWQRDGRKNVSLHGVTNETGRDAQRALYPSI